MEKGKKRFYFSMPELFPGCESLRHPSSFTGGLSLLLVGDTPEKSLHCPNSWSLKCSYTFNLILKLKAT